MHSYARTLPDFLIQCSPAFCRWLLCWIFNPLSAVTENCYVTKTIKMSSGKFIGDDKIGAILALHKESLNNTEISNRLKIARSSVRKWILRAADSPKSASPTVKPRSGRPRKTSEKTNNLIRRMVMETPTISAREIKQKHPELLAGVAIRTLQHRLQKDMKMPSRRPAKKPFLSKAMREKRIAFCKKHKDWSSEQWEKVMFSDESYFVTFTSRPSSVRRPPGSNRLDPKYTCKTVKHSPGVMVWGAFSAKCRGGLYFYPKVPQ